MGTKLVIPGISEEKGFEEINKEDWIPLLFEGDTILLVNSEDEKKKIWVMADEWMPDRKTDEQTEEEIIEKVKEEIKKEPVTETLTLQQVESETEVQGGVSEGSAEVEWMGETVSLDSLKALRLDELLFFTMLEHSEEKIREKLYELFGYGKEE